MRACTYARLLFWAVPDQFSWRDKASAIDTVTAWPWGQWLMRTKVPVWPLPSKSSVAARTYRGRNGWARRERASVVAGEG